MWMKDFVCAKVLLSSESFRATVVIQISKKVLEGMISHARQEAPEECCGLLAGDDEGISEIYRIPNLPSDHPSILDLKVPEDRRFRYVMDPKAQVRAFKKMRQSCTRLQGIYHSHPHSKAYPSATDIRLAYYPEVHYLIISLEQPERPQVRAFRIVSGKATEEKIQEARK